MGRDCTASLIDDLRSANPTESSRWLCEADEPAFRALLRARYGDSYSYPFLYEPGGASRLWRSGRLISLGQFDEQGDLVSHSGLWMAPGRDSVDSGLSLSRPSRRPVGDRAEHALAWRYVLNRLRGHVGFLHQNTSTLHLMAQRYASRFMHAVPVGLVVNYTCGETLMGVEGSGVPMQALAMTTVLGQPPARTRYVPEGEWGEWLLAIFARLGLAETVVQVPTERAGEAGAYVLTEIDWNESLRIERRALVGLSAGARSGAHDPHPSPLPEGEGACCFAADRGTGAAMGLGGRSLRSSRARVDLVHLSMGEPGLVAEATPALIAVGYRPTGIRLHQYEPDEIVFQHIEDVKAACSALGRARLAAQDAQALFSGWSERCARTS